MVLSSNFMTFIDCYKDRKVILYTRVKESQKLFAQYHFYKENDKRGNTTYDLS